MNFLYKRYFNEQIQKNSISIGSIMSNYILNDFVGIRRKVLLEYSGKHKIHLEGRINAASQKMLDVSISLFEEDIVSQKFDENSKIFKITNCHFKGNRIAILPMTTFFVPRDVQKIIVFDDE